jgi:hypothetical protein
LRNYLAPLNSGRAIQSTNGKNKMTEVVNQHGSTPADLKSPVYRHSSETARSQSDAGGKVPVSQYENKMPERKTR